MTEKKLTATKYQMSSYFEVEVDGKKIMAKISPSFYENGGKMKVLIENILFYEVDIEKMLKFLEKNKVIESYQEWMRRGIIHLGDLESEIHFVRSV